MGRAFLIVLVLLLVASFSRAEQTICPQRAIKKMPYNTLTLSKNLDTVVVQPALARAYFKEIIKKDHQIPYDYVEDGCDMRAYFISKILSEKFNANSFRVSLEGTRGPLMADTSKTLEGFVEAHHHTATAFCVETSRGLKVYVLDPSFFKQPVPLEQWVHKFTVTKNRKIPHRLRLSTMYALDPRKKPKAFTRSRTAKAEKEKQHSWQKLRSGRPQHGVITRTREPLSF